MARGIVDMAGLDSPDAKALRAAKTPDNLPFRVTKIGHMVLAVQDLERSVKFYTEVMGFKVSDVYPASMMPGRMVFMRFNEDHHGIALVGQGKEPSRHRELHHLAFEVATIDEVLLAREHLKKHNVPIDFDGRRRAGCQVAVEFRDPDNHCLEIFWGLDRVAWDGEARPPEEWAEEHSLEAAIDHAPPGQDTTLTNPALRRE
jgi:catechol 2,3-dioxygenase